jgi:hypothetical protein
VRILRRSPLRSVVVDEQGRQPECMVDGVMNDDKLKTMGTCARENVRLEFVGKRWSRNGRPSSAIRLVSVKS